MRSTVAKVGRVKSSCMTNTDVLARAMSRMMYRVRLHGAPMVIMIS